MTSVKGWGPSDQRHRVWTKRRFKVAIGALIVLSPVGAHTRSLLLVLLFVLWCLRRRLYRLAAARTHRQPTGAEALATVGGQAGQHRGGVYLGVDRRRWVFSRPERAVLVLGPPRSGKTSGVIIPAVLSHQGPVVSTSTKPDVLLATLSARSSAGTVWQFDPAGTAADLPGVRRLCWSPISAAMSWDGALLMARSMVSGAGVGHGATDSTHWAKRAQAVLAPMLHAAAICGRQMEDVLGWVAAHDCDGPGALLEQAGPGSRLAVLSLMVVANTEQRERGSIFSATADALEAYTSTGALLSAADPNFDADSFVRSGDSVFIHAAADRQGLVAPLVCGLLTQIRQATYQAHHNQQLPSRVLFALDEVANIAPLQELPAIASEGGGQGLLLLAALQDLSQARGRWGVAADGFLTLFGTKLVLPGIADQRTLENVSMMLGEYDRAVVSQNGSGGWGLLNGGGGARSSVTTSTQRTRVLSPGEIANVPAGHAVHLDGVRWELIKLTPAFSSQPWSALIDGGAR